MGEGRKNYPVRPQIYQQEIGSKLHWPVQPSQPIIPFPVVNLWPNQVHSTMTLTGFTLINDCNEREGSITSISQGRIQNNRHFEMVFRCIFKHNYPVRPQDDHRKWNNRLNGPHWPMQLIPHFLLAICGRTRYTKCQGILLFLYCACSSK